jgi:hypothetical protein
MFFPSLSWKKDRFIYKSLKVCVIGMQSVHEPLQAPDEAVAKYLLRGIYIRNG